MEEGIKADRQQWEKRMGGWKDKEEALITQATYCPQTKWINEGGIWRHRKDLTVHGRLKLAQLNSAMIEHPHWGREERGKGKMVQKFEAYFKLPLALINGLASSLSLTGRRSQRTRPWVNLWKIVMNLHTIALGAHLKHRPGSMSAQNAAGHLQKLKMAN